MEREGRERGREGDRQTDRGESERKQREGSESVIQYLVGQKLPYISSHIFQADFYPPGDAPRPLNTWLDSSKLATMGIAKCTGFSEGVYKCLSPILTGGSTVLIKTESQIHHLGNGNQPWEKIRGHIAEVKVGCFSFLSWNLVQLVWFFLQLV